MKGIIKFIVTATVCLVLSDASFVQAQQAQLSLSTELNEILSNSQSVNIQSLAQVNGNGKGPNIFRLFLRNEGAERASNLYFNISVRSEKAGEIVNIYQREGQSFSLAPAQVVYTANNNIGNLPGIEEIIQFEGGITSVGKQFLNSLQGSVDLPRGRYILEVEIYQGHNKRQGGMRVASAIAEIGTNIVENTYGLYLFSPGDAFGTKAATTNKYPNFQWQGTAGTSYRLVVVEARESESPQSLISGAVNTPPIELDGSSVTGSLIGYEMLDVIVGRPGFQYPNAGVQPLEPGKRYYWQVLSQLQTSSGIEARESEIWGFTVAERNSPNTVQNGAFEQALQKVLGEEYEGFLQKGYSFESVEIGGQTYQGGQALQKLMELSRKAEQGEVSIIIEGQ